MLNTITQTVFHHTLNSNTVAPTVFYRTLNVEGLKIFYREASPRDAPTVLLLHGFPSSSHMFRNLIPMLADEYHVIAQTSLDTAKVQHRRSTISTIPSKG
jgi:hypothetical protein